MRAKKRRGAKWAAWLGLLALAVNALVPIHLAFDLAEGLAPARHSVDDEAGSAERHLLALLSGHREAESSADEHGKHEHGHRDHHGCPVCSAFGALTGLVLPTPVLVPVADATELTAALPPTEIEPAGTPAGYRSRAPPTHRVRQILRDAGPLCVRPRLFGIFRGALT
jgi:hypothetical protein